MGWWRRRGREHSIKRLEREDAERWIAEASVRLPILVILEDGELEAFDTVLGAETAVEAPDLNEPGVEAFDATGRRLRLVSLAPPPEQVGPRWLGITSVEIDPIRLEEAPQRPGDGPGLLRQRLAEVMVRDAHLTVKDAGRRSLDELLALVRAHYTRPGR